MINLANSYKKGCGCKIDNNKCKELLEKASEMGSSIATMNLGFYYKDIEKDFDQSALMFHKASLRKDEQATTSVKLLNTIISTNKIVWAPFYHKYWVSDGSLNGSILVLLLISKFRNKSCFRFVNSLVKGVTMNIVKFLCHFEQVLLL